MLTAFSSINTTVSLSEPCYDEHRLTNGKLLGDWSGATFWQNGCTGTTSSLLANGGNFSKAYWLINSVKIYQ